MNLEQAAQRAQDGDREALTALCGAFAPLLKKAAAQPYLRPFYEDALAGAQLAFIEAVYAYRAGGKVPFAGYAQSRVRFAVWNLYKKERRLRAKERSADVETAPGVRIIDTFLTAGDIAAQAETSLLAGELVKLSARLPPRQRAALLDAAAGVKAADTARRLRVTPQAVYGLRGRAAEKMRALWQRKGAK